MYAVVRYDGSTLSRTSPTALLSWVDEGVTRATEYRYAVTFATYRGAAKCAAMQGGLARRVSWIGTVVRPCSGRGLGPWVDSFGLCSLVDSQSVGGS